MTTFGLTKATQKRQIRHTQSTQMIAQSNVESPWLVTLYFSSLVEVNMIESMLTLVGAVVGCSKEGSIVGKIVGVNDGALFEVADGALVGVADGPSVGEIVGA